MTEEFNLSDRVIDANDLWNLNKEVIREEDVKEFIKRLKEECKNFEQYDYLEMSINRLAGEKLI